MAICSVFSRFRRNRDEVFIVTFPRMQDALKSSAKLIGAVEFAETAQFLENAGKANALDDIRERHADFMREYAKYKERLDGVFREEREKTEAVQKPVADRFLMDSVYEGLREAAGVRDLDAIEEIMEEIAPYEIPGEEKERLEKIIKAIDSLDYEGILTALKGV